MDAILYGPMAYQKTDYQNLDELGSATKSTTEFVNNINNIKKLVFQECCKRLKTMQNLLEKILQKKSQI
jgi:hypothetical protein